MMLRTQRWHSLYSKISLTFALVILIPFAFLITYNITTIRDNQLALTSEQSLNELREQRATLINEIDVICNNIRFLSRQHDVQMFVDGDFKDTRVKDEVTQTFVNFAEQMGIYDQIRLLSPDGMEVIRVNYAEDSPPIVVPENELQDKSDRAYFLEAITVPAGEVYLSPIELNQEAGEIEIPYKPVLRYAVPIYKTNGDLGGVLVLNVLIKKLFEAITTTESRHISYFVNNNGDFIYTNNDNSDILYASDLGHTQTLQTTFPAIAAASANAEDGTITDREQGLFLGYSSMSIVRGQREINWILIDEHDLDIVLQSVNATSASILFIGLAAVIITLIVAGLITRTLVRPLEYLTEAVKKLQKHHWDDARKLSKMVTTRDEVGELAYAFEDMLHELQTVHESLEERVEERTIELAAANAQLKKLDSIKMKFMEDMNHEVRTPLSSILLNVEMINRQPHQREYYVERIINHIKRLRFLLDNISAVTRMDIASEKPDFEHFRLEETVRSIVEMHRTLAENNELELRFSTVYPLPGILGHRNQLSQVVDNLITNAIKYTKEGSITVQLGYEKDSKQLTLRVQDTGMGISPDDMQYLFERYYRAEDVRQSSIPGSGLGLSIAKEIVEWHGGRITVESEVNQGTTVTVYLSTIHSQKLAQPVV